MKRGLFGGFGLGVGVYGRVDKTKETSFFFFPVVSKILKIRHSR
jgi:hypothetical protein